MNKRFNQTRAIVSDLINDWRASQEYFRTGEYLTYHDTAALVALAEGDYRCLQQVRHLYRNRHSVKLGQYGWPVGMPS